MTVGWAAVPPESGRKLDNQTVDPERRPSKIIQLAIGMMGLPFEDAATMGSAGRPLLTYGGYCMRNLLIAGTVAISMTMAACGPEGPTKADTGLAVGAVAGGILGNAAGHGRGGKAAGTIIGAVVGGIVGSEIGRSMDRQDRILARQAEMDAWERGEPGRPYRWDNRENGRYGEIVSGPVYHRGPSNCRDFTHTIYIDGRPQAMRGTACRNSDGTWTQVG